MRTRTFTLLLLLLALAISCTTEQEKSHQGITYTLDVARDAYYAKSDYATARHICRSLLEQSEIQNDSVALLEVYSLMTLVATAEANEPDVMRYATEAERLARLLNQPDEVGRMQSHIAASLIRMGQVDEGWKHLTQAVERLRPLKTFGGLTAYISAVKKQIHYYYACDRQDMIPPLCRQILDRLDDFLQHANDYNDLPKGFDIDDFSDFTRGQTYSCLAMALGNMGHRQEALHWLSEAENTKWSHRINGAQMLLSAYESLELWDKLEATCRRLDEWRTDTLTSNYAIELQAKAQAALARGRLSEVLLLKDRVINLMDTIHKHENAERMAELATIYRLQDAQLEQQSAHAAAIRSYIYLACSLLLLLLTVGFTYYYYHQRRLLRRKNHALAEQISEAIAYKEKYLAETAKVTPIETPHPDQLDTLADDQLFGFLQQVIEQEKLFLDPNFGRQTLIDRFHLSKERVGTAFAHGSQHSSLADYINNRRLEHACLSLVAHPEMNISEIAAASGFNSASVFSRNFKTKYSVTPTEYRIQHL